MVGASVRRALLMEDTVRLVKIVCIGLLVVYTITLICLEAGFSQDYVRNYFTDTTGPVFFYAINTTLSSSLLWAIALVFVITALGVDESPGWKKKKLFYYSQALLFLYLGTDERFLLHETINAKFGVNDTSFLVGIGMVELALLFILGDLKARSRKTKAYLFVGAVLSGISIIIDGFAPARAFLRLSVEDLSKVWAEVFLFLFAFEMCRGMIDDLKKRTRVFESVPHRTSHPVGVGKYAQDGESKKAAQAENKSTEVAEETFVLAHPDRV